MMSLHSTTDVIDDINSFQKLCKDEFSGLNSFLHTKFEGNNDNGRNLSASPTRKKEHMLVPLKQSPSSSHTHLSPIHGNKSSLINFDKTKGLSILERIRLEERLILEVAISYRLSVLRKVGTFAHLSAEIVEATAHCLEDLRYACGDVIVRQDDSGDGFYVLEEGDVEVTKKRNSNDKREIPQVLATLGKNSTFGEVSLLTDEPRSATVTVISPNGAKCLRLGKEKFQELMVTKNKAAEEVRTNIASDVIEMVPIFKGITGTQKQKLMNAMVPIDYWPNSYIVRQGTIGATFYIVTEGTCKVSIHTEDGKELDVATLTVGDFFGEIALMELSNKRTANVVSIDNVSVLSLAKSEFVKLFKNLKAKFLENQAVKRMVGVNQGQPIELLKKRRISAFNHHNLKDKIRTRNLYKRFCKVVVESLWSSLYSRIYARMVLMPKVVNEYGGILEQIMLQNAKIPDRWTAVTQIQKAAVEALKKEPSQRSMSDHLIIIGLMSQRNQLRQRVCKDWSRNEYVGLCRKVGYTLFPAMRKLFEIDAKGTTGFLILRGNIRIFKKVKVGHQFKMIFEEDLCSGDVLCEEQLTGTINRSVMAFALTNVDVVTIDYNDFQNSQDRATSILSHDERSVFFSHVELLKSWELYKISRLTFTVLQKEAFKGQKLIERGVENKDLIFLLNGRLDVVTNTIPPTTIATINKFEYIGETGFLNSREDPTDRNNTKHNFREKFNVVALTRVDILVIPYDKFEWLTADMYRSVKSGYLEKTRWRQERNDTILYEKRNGLEASTNVLLNAMRTKKEQTEVEANKMHDAIIHAEAEKIYNGKGGDIDNGNYNDDGSLDESSSKSEYSFSSTSGSPSVSEYTAASTYKDLRPLVEESRHKFSSAKNFHSPTLTHDIDPCVALKELDDLEDIPALAYKGFDPHMVLPTLTTFRDANNLRQNLKSVQGPKIVRVLKKSAVKESDLGFKNLHSEFFRTDEVVSLDRNLVASLDDLRPKGLLDMDTSHLGLQEQRRKVMIPLLSLSPPMRKPKQPELEGKLRDSVPFGVDINKLARQKGIIKKTSI